MQVEYKLKLGIDEFLLKCEAKDEIEFFEKMSFYSNLPRTAPNGATDLKLVHRTTKEGHNYYSLISEKEQQEYKFGQVKQTNGGGLYPRGWEPLHNAGNAQVSSAPIGGASYAPAVQTARPAASAPIGAPVGALIGQALAQAPVTMASPAQPQYSPLVTAPVAQPVQAAVPQYAPAQAALVTPPVAAQAPTINVAPSQPAVPPVNPQVQAMASDVLARFGIKQ